MATKPYAKTSCFRLGYDNSQFIDYLKFDEDYEYFNLKFYRNGWIKWQYNSDILENYILDQTIALASLKGGASLNLQFYLVEFIPTTDVLAGGIPTTFQRAEVRTTTIRSILHTAGQAQVLGGMSYNIRMTMDSIPRITLPVHIEKSRWFRIFVSYVPPVACTGNSVVLSGYGAPVLDYQEGLLYTSDYVTERLPFAQIEAIRVSSPLSIADLAAMQIPSLEDVAIAKQEAIEQSQINLLDDLADSESQVSQAVLDLVGTEGTTIEEVKEALITDLSDSTSDFSVAVLDLVGNTQDFIVEPDLADINVGGNFEFDVNLFNGLNISSIQAISSDTTKVTVSINSINKKLIVTGVAPGSATVTVSSTAISKTQDLAITVNEPSEATFKATDVSDDLILYKMWVNLNTTTGELTLDNPNGSNIILAGWVVGIDTTAKTALIRYLKANPANYQLDLEPGLTVAQGDPVILNNGIGSTTGYTVPNCTYSNDGGYVNVAVTASDIITLEQHKII